jgi:hypothetical protein
MKTKSEKRVERSEEREKAAVLAALSITAHSSSLTPGFQP